MSDRLLRQLVATLTTLAVLTVVLDVPAALRVPAVLAFAVLGPGLAVTRFVPTLSSIDRLAVAGATSFALNIVASLLLVAVGRWSGEPVLATLAGGTLVLVFLPEHSPRRARRERQEQIQNRERRDRRRAQALAYEQVQSTDARQRSAGLMALSWLLEDDGRRAEAARLRSLSRLESPPRLLLDRPGIVDEKRLRDAHQSARSEDPETRRHGLFEVASLLDEWGRNDEADTLRDVAASDDPPR
jgi:hypothetical protein